jgi:hypothetical protein
MLTFAQFKESVLAEACDKKAMKENGVEDDTEEKDDEECDSETGKKCDSKGKK